MNCGICKEKDCCKTGKDCTGIREEILKRYEDDPASRKIMEAAASLESEGYMLLTRVEEVAQFAKKWAINGWELLFALGCKEKRRHLKTCSMLFIKLHRCAARSAVSVVKDRLLANNPAGALLSPYWEKTIKDKMKIIAAI